MAGTLKRAERRRAARHELSDSFWSRVEPLLPHHISPTPSGGRPRLNLRAVATTVFFVLKTGCQWLSVPREAFGCSGPSAHRYFQEWVRADVFLNLWRKGLLEYDDVRGIDWKWQSIDGAMTKAPLAEEVLDPIPQTVPSLVPSGRCRRMGLGSQSA
jgi:transposase